MAAGFERAHVELDYYDGPRAGLADFQGVPHYFQAAVDHAQADAPDGYLVWPAGEAAPGHGA